MSYWRGCVGGWGLGRAALFEGGGLSPVGQLWVVGHPTHDERTAKVSLEHKLQGGMGKTIYFSYANGASDLKLYLPSKKKYRFHCVLVSSYQHEMFAKENLK